MILTYNLSDSLKKSLSQFDDLRSHILLTPLSPSSETKLQWDATINRIYIWLSLANISITRMQIASALSMARKPKTTTSIKQILNYRLALNHIYHDWLANPGPITFSDIQHVADYTGYTISNKQASSHILKYLQVTPNINPLIQAAIIHLHFSSTPIAHLAPLIFLYKYGFDLRGLMCPGSIFVDEKQEYFKTIQGISRSTTLTLWLEFYTESIVRNARHIKRLISDVKATCPSERKNRSLNLNERQKQLLSLFDEPEISLTNKKVQSLFKVSQVTASRDLSKLASLGLLFPHGKGRSTYYTRV